MAFEFPIEATDEVLAFVHANPNANGVTPDIDPVTLGSRAIAFANAIQGQRVEFPAGTKAPAIPTVVAEGVDEQIRYGLRIAGQDSTATDAGRFAAYKASLAKPVPPTKK